ncbi:hypothetical protein BX285_5996 [Streptomyces sp. 1114.5]|uniref:hypothetical protein n=1 Tax=Streptomyces sp. 1114.5 TaxID=1938830 RepID=UPI000F2D2316|nr:hypothetical protein [Streptomyces sp. 1114.5]RKT12031.1 hypothetical protein BX285_5996 [Streptomyces sp. 1114.5]
MTEGGQAGGSRVSATHVMASAVVFAIPVLKLAWTLGGGDAARDALLAIGPVNWLDVVIGMFCAEPVLAVVLAAVASHVTYAVRAAQGGAARHRGRALAETVARAAILPGALGVVVGALQRAVVGRDRGCPGLPAATRGDRRVPYGRSLRRHRSPHRPAGRDLLAAGRRGRPDRGPGAHAGRAPGVSVVAALDGRSWTSVLMCDVNTGSGPQRARLVELAREAPGVVGWDVPAHEMVSGTNCAVDPDDVLRDPWWRSR